MKTMVFFILMACAINVQAGTVEECTKRYQVRDRLKVYIQDVTAYQECVRDGILYDLEVKRIQSEIELNEQKTKWLKDEKFRQRYYRRFPPE